MSVLDSKALHEQLSVIMATLSKAAVAEICAAVDEGYALLQAEIHRSHQENRDLRAKLQLIESIVIRGSVSDKPPVSAHPGEGWRPPWRPEPGAAAEREQEREREQEQEQEQELPEVVLIKDEDDDGSGAHGEADPQDRRSDPGAAGVGGASRSRAHRAASWGGEGASSLISPDSPRSEPGRGAEETEAGEPACAYASQADADLHLRQQDRPAPLPPGVGGHAYFGDGGLTESCSDMDMDLGMGLGLGPSPSLDPALAWNKAPAKNPTAFPHFHQSEDADAFGLKMLDVSGAAPTDSAFEYGAVVNFTLNREQTGRAAAAPPAKRSRRFVCSVCNKTYASSQNLEVHMRIHTGQKPFSCDHCGKKFTQSAHLKSHLTIHSGERPHACALCGRSFIAKYSLELHMARQHPPATNDTASGPPPT